MRLRFALENKNRGDLVTMAFKNKKVPDDLVKEKMKSCAPVRKYTIVESSGDPLVIDEDRTVESMVSSQETSTASIFDQQQAARITRLSFAHIPVVAREPSIENEHAADRSAPTLPVVMEIPISRNRPTSRQGVNVPPSSSVLHGTAVKNSGVFGARKFKINASSLAKRRKINL